jgi:YHS domain-containing protein
MKFKYSFLLLLAFLSYSHSFVAQNTPAEKALRVKHTNIEKSGLAIQGYDPISYFLGTPQQGLANYSYTYNGITYRFATSKNLDLFKTAPAKFEPAYGGWCAYAMGATGEKVEVDPQTYKIINGKLFLFYNSFFNNTLPKWNSNEKELNKKADSNWIKIYN